MRNFLIGVLPVCFVALVVGLGFGFYYHPVIMTILAILLNLAIPLALLVCWLIGIIGFKRVPPKKLLLFTYGDDLVYGVMNFPGRHFDPNGRVAQGQGPSEYWYGDCRWIIRWRRWVLYFGWFVWPVSYDENNNPDGFGFDIYVDLSDHFVTVNVEEAETKDNIPDPDNPGEMIPGPAASYDAQCPGRVVDPRLFVIGSPPNVFQDGIASVFEAIMRKWGRLKTESELLNAGVSGGASGIGAELQDPAKVDAQSAFDIMSERWGFELAIEDITIRSITFNRSYQDARQDVRLEAMKAQAADARIYGPVKRAIAAGIDPKDAVRLRGLDMGATADLSDRKETLKVEGLEGIQYLSTGGAGGMGVMLPAPQPKGGKNPGGNPKGGNPGGGQKDVAQLAEEHFRQNGKYPPWDPLKRTPN